MNRYTSLLLAVVALVCPPSAFARPPAATYEVTVDHWADGDTLIARHCHGTFCVLEKIRLHGFDAPEIAHNSKEADQPGGKEALAYVTEHFGKGVKLTISPHGGLSYGRTVADVQSGDTDVAVDLAKQGDGMADERYSPSKELKAAVADAKENKRGIWATENPETPWDYRARIRAEKHPLLQKLKGK